MQTLLMMLAMAVCDAQPPPPGAANPCLEWERTNPEVLGSRAKEQTSLAAGQTISTSDPRSILRLLRDHGYSGELEADQYGDPMILIMSGADGELIQMLFNDCEDHKNCQALMLRSTFDVPGPRGESLEAINSWNSSGQQYSRAFIDREGHAVLDMPLVAVDGELTLAQLLEALRLFADLAPPFEQHIRPDRR